MQVVTATVFYLLLIVVNCEKSDDQRKASTDKAINVLIDMYTTLRDILYPKSPLSINKPTSTRFVLLSPGKILSYQDYHPGEDYLRRLSQSRGNSSYPEPVIPPSVMEKWFDVADVMVGADPFTGGITAKSLARSYETIVTQMKLKGLDKKSAETRAKYNKAINFLTTPIPDPDNLTMTATRLTLYSRYQDEYAQKKLEMEEAINSERRNRGSLDYELWFQRVYPSLNAKVKGAYTKWLTFGQKELVELYNAYLDTESAGVEIEEARMSLLESGVKSLDRTRTVYPVSFEPGNWYECLKTK